jgi:hypothetical protein
VVDGEGLVVDVVDDERVPAEDGGEQVPRRDPVVVHVKELEGKNLHWALWGSEGDVGGEKEKGEVWG